ncbi:MAG: L-fucose/L-arabinose isomerase family protein [Pelolinea sp.]|nr:L-fucose/L-arabinose isomerase family protein [Pelolinea sp.]
MMKKEKRNTLGLIIGTRDFFPAEPVREGRKDIVSILDHYDVDFVTLDEETTRFGAVETWEDSKKCADLFKNNRDRIDGILVLLPVFGPERAVADTLKLAKLDVPVLIQAYPDDLEKLNVELRRDSFCGKLSVTNNLYQYGIPFSLTKSHTIHPSTEEFKKDFEKFIGVCRVVNGLRNARLGAVGARPTIFNTVRYSEKLLERAGISVSTVDLSEILGAAKKINPDDSRVKAKLDEINNYVNTQGIPSDPLIKLSKLGVILDDWVDENEIDALSLQCWTSIQENYGINACTLMSMMSNKLIPNACEVDLLGSLTMYAMQLASGKPSALVDWNNNYANEKDKCMLFHCGNWAKSFFDEEIKMSYGEILATVLGKENTYGTISARAAATPVTVARIETDDYRGCIKSYISEGQLTNDPLDTFGCRAVLEIKDLQVLMQYVCKKGYAHHSAINPENIGSILEEAFETYLGWEVYFHK